MPVYRLDEDLLLFPRPELADEDGLLAVGGDLRVERLTLAYALGIFPWYDADQPILWWSPESRCLIELNAFHASRSLRRRIRRGGYEVRLDTDFSQVIRSCGGGHRALEEGCWLHDEMIDAYLRLHALGLAHSVEVWSGETLVGGLYGVALGSAFFGESMFSRQTDASKIAVAALVAHLHRHDFTLLDAQVASPHLLTLGAVETPRGPFLRRLAHALTVPTRKGPWIAQDLEGHALLAQLQEAARRPPPTTSSGDPHNADA